MKSDGYKRTNICFHLREIPRTGKFMGTKCMHDRGYQALGEGSGKLYFMGRVSVWEDEKVLETNTPMAAQHSKHTGTTESHTSNP